MGFSFVYTPKPRSSFPWFSSFYSYGAERYKAALALAGRARGGAPAMDRRTQGASAAA